MAKKEYLVILILLIVIFALSIAIINVDTKQTNSTNVTHEIIANDTLQDSGTVEVIKNLDCRVAESFRLLAMTKLFY